MASDPILNKQANTVMESINYKRASNGSITAEHKKMKANVGNYFSKKDKKINTKIRSGITLKETSK